VRLYTHIHTHIYMCVYIYVYSPQSLHHTHVLTQAQNADTYTYIYTPIFSPPPVASAVSLSSDFGPSSDATSRMGTFMCVCVCVWLCVHLVVRVPVYGCVCVCLGVC
jgi:hypothetical protein